MQVTCLIIPDIHEQITKLKGILEKYPNIPVIFLGDWFDSFDGLTEETYRTCQWLAENIDNPLYTFIFGNHDMHYVFPFNGVMCSGFDPKKLAIIKNTIRDEQWRKFKLFHWLQTADSNEYLCSHAGLHPYLLNPMKGVDKKWLDEQAEEALYKVRYEQVVTPFIDVGRARGGNAKVGGVVWLDWNLEFEPIEGLNQIVGHTPDYRCRNRVIRKKELRYAEVSRNYCVDTHLKHVILVCEDGSLKIEGV